MSLMTDEEEYQQELNDGIDDCILYLALAKDAVKSFRELKDLFDDIGTMLGCARDEKKRINDEDYPGIL